MAWRIDEQIVRAELDCRVRGRVTGRLWLVGRKAPVELELKGSPWRDLAGHVLRMKNPNPVAGIPEGFQDRQVGVVGDITASRKVRVPECSQEELMQLYAEKKPFPWHWGNGVYLEWFSETNGRVVIESAAFEMELEMSGGWEMSREEEEEQRAENAKALTGFMERLGRMAGGDEDDAQSEAEREADSDAARMDLLLDRITARMDREDCGEDDFERIMEEERARMARERGEKEPSAEELAERQERMAEFEAGAAEAAAELEAERWKGEEREEVRHPLVELCSELAVRVRVEVVDAGWMDADAHREHPLLEMGTRMMSASAKLAGALGMAADEEWPPDEMMAGNTLVRLKKARGYLRDVLGALESADEEGLATREWRTDVRREVGEILGEVQVLIGEVRGVMGGDE